MKEIFLSAVALVVGSLAFASAVLGYMSAKNQYSNQKKLAAHLDELEKEKKQDIEKSERDLANATVKADKKTTADKHDSSVVGPLILVCIIAFTCNEFFHPIWSKYTPITSEADFRANMLGSPFTTKNATTHKTIIFEPSGVYDYDSNKHVFFAHWSWGSAPYNVCLSSPLIGVACFQPSITSNKRFLKLENNVDKYISKKPLFVEPDQ